MKEKASKLKEKLVIFAVSFDERLKVAKEFIIKYKIIVIVLLTLISLGLYGFCGQGPDKSENDTPLEKMDDNESTLKEEITKGYTVVNQKMYQSGIDQQNKMKDKLELWKRQAGVPYMLGDAIKKTAKEKNRTESDMADYYYGGITGIKDDTKANLHNLEIEGANSEVLEYEKKILDFIENVLENYSIDYTLSEEKQNEYFSWIDNNNHVLDSINNKSDEETQENVNDEADSTSDVNLNIKFGTFEQGIKNGDILVVKAKITPSYNNKATINQNNFNVQDIVKNQGGNTYKEIQYWAVADMEDGSESKVISFTISESVIQMIANDSIPGNAIMDYATDVWILPSLRN